MDQTRHDYYHVFDVYVPIGIGVFVLFAGLIVFAAIRYRRRDGERPGGPSEAPRAELLYVAALAGIVALLATITFKTEATEDRVSAKSALQINVLGSKWQWRFTYPAYGISVVSSDVRPAAFVVPTGQTVRFRVTSLDVIHSFYIPALRFKRDAFPDSTNSFDLTFDRPRFMGQCAEFCGVHHADMRFAVEAVPPPEFRSWASQQQRDQRG